MILVSIIAATFFVACLIHVLNKHSENKNRAHEIGLIEREKEVHIKEATNEIKETPIDDLVSDHNSEISKRK